MSIWQRIFGGNDSEREEKSSRESSSSSSSAAAAATKGKKFKSEEDYEKPVEVRLAKDDFEIFEDIKGGKIVETNRETVEAAKARRQEEEEKKKARGKALFKRNSGQSKTVFPKSLNLDLSSAASVGLTSQLRRFIIVSSDSDLSHPVSKPIEKTLAEEYSEIIAALPEMDLTMLSEPELPKEPIARLKALQQKIATLIAEAEGFEQHGRYDKAADIYEFLIANRYWGTKPYVHLISILKAVGLEAEARELRRHTEAFFVKLRSRQERRLLALADRQGCLEMIRKRILDRKKIAYSDGLFTLYDPFTELDRIRKISPALLLYLNGLKSQNKRKNPSRVCEQSEHDSAGEVRHGGKDARRRCDRKFTIWSKQSYSESFDHLQGVFLHFILISSPISLVYLIFPFFTPDNQIKCL